MPVYLFNSFYHACVSTHFMVSCLCIYTVYGIVVHVYLLSVRYHHACVSTQFIVSSCMWRTDQ